MNINFCKSYYFKKEIGKLIEFKTNIDNIKLNIQNAYKIVSKYEKKWGWHLDQKYYQVMNEVITDFVKVTEWLADELAKESTNEQKEYVSKNKLVQSWIQVAKLLVEILETTSSVSTTFKDSWGLGDGGSGISNIVLNLEGVDYEKRPYFRDSLFSASNILLDNDEFDLASRYALMSAIESIWGQDRYDKEDVTIALDIIPSYLWKKQEYSKYIEYIIKIFNICFPKHYHNTWIQKV